MADLTITAANVLAGTNATKGSGIAGVAITAGQQIYLDPASNTWKLADTNGAVGTRVASATALDNAAAGQPLQYQTSGPVTIGATVTPGVMYYLSATPGAICPVADLTTGCYPCAIGFAISSTQISLNYQSAGVSL